MQLLFLLNLGCTGDGYGYSGFGTLDYFAFEGERQWTYSLEGDDSGDTKLSVEKLAPETINSLKYMTFEYFIEDPYETLGTLTWVSGGVDGIGITSYTIGEDDALEEVIFDNTAIFAKTRMAPGDVVESSVNGVNISSTLVGNETCPNNWSTGQDWDCLHFTITADQEGSGFPFLGDYWLAVDWGASRFQVTEGPWAQSAEWVLLGAEEEVVE